MRNLYDHLVAPILFLICTAMYQAPATALPDNDEEVFTIVVETSETETVFQFVADGAVSLGVNWGDGHSEIFDGDVDPSHDYGEEGEWVIEIEGRADRLSFYTGMGEPHPQMLKDILTPVSAGLSGIVSAREMFRMTTVESFSCEDFFDEASKQVTDMEEMFAGSLFDQDISGWDVSRVESMSGMFHTTPFNQDISGWDVSQVEDMSRMFSHSSFNQHIGSWDVSRVTNMEGMFSGDVFEQHPFNQDIGGWDVSQVEDMANMFWHAAFNQDISSWDVSRVETMELMFSKSEFNQDIGEWDVSMVQNMRGMFRESEFNQDIGEWDVSLVTDMSAMFWQTSFNQHIGAWDVGRVNNMSGMFRGAEDFNQDIGGWDVSMVTDMSWMFHTSAFNHDIGEWDVSNVEDMRHMFLSAPFDQDIGGWDVSQVEDMSFMFRQSSFNQDIGDWDVIRVRDMQYMFNGSPFDQDISRWDVSNVENFDIFLAFARLSTENYNQLLIAWSDLDLEKDLKFHGGESTYDAGEPEERRQYIIDTFGWEINDGGLAVPLYRLELIAEPAEGGSVSGGGEFAEDEVVRIEATPEQGWGFIQWSDAEGDMISSEEAFDYTMPAGHMTLTATFDDEVSVSDPAVIQAKVYPNPATDFVQVKAESRVVSYRLTDENGRSVRVQDVGASAFYIPLSGLNPGVYFLELQSDKGKASHRIILMP